MLVWTVQLTGGEDDRMEAAPLAADSGALVALSEETLRMGAGVAGHRQALR
jgi:hypothetical protein